MKYCISTNYFATFRDLTQEEFIDPRIKFDPFADVDRRGSAASLGFASLRTGAAPFKICSQVSNQFFRLCQKDVCDTTGWRPVIVSHRKDWVMTEDDLEIENNIASDPDPNYRKTLVRIFAASMLKDAPDWLIRNQRHFKDWIILFENGSFYRTRESGNVFMTRDWLNLHRYLDLADDVRENYQIAKQCKDTNHNAESSPGTILLEPKENATESTSDTEPPANEDRDRRLYELSNDLKKTWEEIAEEVNAVFPDALLDAGSAATAARRYAKRYSLTLKKRKSGRKPTK